MLEPTTLTFYTLPSLSEPATLPDRDYHSTCQGPPVYLLHYSLLLSVCQSLYLQVCYSLPLYLPVIQPLCLLQSVTLSACHFIYQSVTACLSTHLLVPVIQPPACQSILLKLHTKNQTSNLQNGRNDELH